MAVLQVRVHDASHRPLPDRMDVQVLAGETVVREIRDVDGASQVNCEVLDHRAYAVRVRPQRHRAVAHVVLAGDGAQGVPIFAPLHPDHAVAVFPTYDVVPAPIAALLTAEAYGELADDRRAGLLNVFAKMAAAGVWGDVQRIRVIRRDRIFANVRADLVDRVGADPKFRRVSGRLHTSPVVEYSVRLGSFKTREPYGNLQLTFFGSATDRVLVDADVDDAAGFEHVFQVLGHWLTKGATHPYDIHELLAFAEVQPAYQLT